MQGPVDIILGTSPDSSVEVAVKQMTLEHVEPNPSSQNSIAAGKPTLEEKSQRGMVKWSTCRFNFDLYDVY